MRGGTGRCRGRYHDDGTDAGETGTRDAGAMADVTAGGDATVAEGGVGELGCVLHRQCQAAGGANVAGLAGGGAERHMLGRRRHQGRAHLGRGIGCGIGRAVALRAIARGRRRIGVDIDKGRHHGEVGIGVASRATGAGRSRYVIGRLVDCRKRRRIAMAQRAIA